MAWEVLLGIKNLQKYSEMNSQLVLDKNLGSWCSLNNLVDSLLGTKPDTNRNTHPVVSWFLSKFVKFVHILKLVHFVHNFCAFQLIKFSHSLNK